MKMKLKKLFNYCRNLVLRRYRLHIKTQYHSLKISFEDDIKLEPLGNEEIADISIENNDLDKNKSGMLNMAERPDLLISLEKIMTKSFPTLQSFDTLANAFSVFTLQNLKEIVVIDSNGLFLGIASASKIYRKMPPSILDFPALFRTKDKEEMMVTSILEVSRKKVSEDLTLDQPSRIFQTTSPLSSLLFEINSLYNYHLKPKIIPVFGKDKIVKGMVTYKEILTYLKNDPVLTRSTVSDLSSDGCLQEYSSVLASDDNLATAKLIMEHTLTDCILGVSNDGSILGYLDKIWINKFICYDYFKLLNVPLKYLLRPLDKSLKFVDANDSLLDVIHLLLEDDVKILVRSESIDLNSQIRVITPLTIVSFFLSSFKSTPTDLLN